ncbi:unnamed protein product, partial [Pylaiella littoralis]
MEYGSGCHLGCDWPKYLTSPSCFSLLILSRLIELREHLWKCFPKLLHFAMQKLDDEEFEAFLQNFEERGDFFWEMEHRWIEWTDRHRHLRLSMARLGCSSFSEGKWTGWEKAFEHAVGQEFARAVLVVLWPDAWLLFLLSPAAPA